MASATAVETVKGLTMMELKEVFIFILMYSLTVGGVLLNTLRYRDPALRESRENMYRRVP